MKKQRKHYTPEEKVAILRRHLMETEPISKLTNTGISTFRTQNSAELSIACAAFWTAAAATS